MRQVIVSNTMSVDGYYEGPGRHVMALNVDEGFDAYNLERIRAAGMVVLAVPSDNPRSGFLRGLARSSTDMVAGYREAGVDQLNIALRAGPYDWDALAAFAEDVMPQFQ